VVDPNFVRLLFTSLSSCQSLGCRHKARRDQNPSEYAREILQVSPSVAHGVVMDMLNDGTPVLFVDRATVTTVVRE
jgi:hypothetical protein